jgi:Domain of unknown function (DUF4440)
MKSKIWIFILTESLAFATATDYTAKAESVEAEVRAAEAARTNALVHGDVDALEKLMADDVTYVHASRVFPWLSRSELLWQEL